MPLPDEDACMVNGLCKSQLEDQCLQSPFEKVLGAESQHIIQLVLALFEQTIFVHSA